MNEILCIVDELKEIMKSVQCSMAENLCESIKSSYYDNKFHLGIVGEFKRGKSTMINSLIGRELLPTDILPTTAVINILEYSNNEYAKVYYNDGKTEDIKVENEALFDFTSEGRQETENIKFIKIGLNNELLKDGLVIIDTPGVNDISKSRIEVTKNILPNCESVWFLLDAAAPLTRTEAEFLETKILKYKMSTLKFIISKADRLDEDELEESIEGAVERIKKVALHEADVMPYSSKDVIRTENMGMESVYKTNLIQNIKSLRKESEENKFLHNKERIKLIVDLIEEEILEKQSILDLDEKQIENAKNNLELIVKDNNIKFEKLILSCEFVGRKTLKEMFDVSLRKLKNEMINEFTDNIRIESNVDDYWNRRLPVQFERYMRKFSEDKSMEIYNYMTNLTKHIVSEYNRNFNTPILINLKESGISIPEWRFEQENRSSIIPMVNRLFPVTMGAVIGSVFMPGIGTALGSAGGQVLSMTLREKNNNELKNQLLSNISEFVSQALEEYEKCVYKVIDDAFDTIFSNMNDIHKNNEAENMRKLNVNGNCSENENTLEKEKLKNIKKSLKDIKLRLIKLS